MRYALLLIPAVLICLTPSTGSAEDRYFQQFVHYTIRTRLDTKNHKLTGTETILYKNNSPDTLQVFYLHLYPNAYKSKNSPLMKDFRRRFNYTFMDIPKKYRGSLDISNVTIDGVSVTPEIDYTIAKIDLPAPLAPGDSMTVSLEFDEKIRRHAGRAGYRGNHYDLAQWYPKVVVYDDEGFHPDPFRTGEFYGEFGKFDVYMDVPDNYVVAATGVVEEGDPGWSLNPVGGKGSRDAKKDGDTAYKTVHFAADNVHDFAWNADPNFAVQDTAWNDIEIRSFFNKNNKAWKDTTLAHGIRAVEWLSEKVGLYPYPQVSVVEALLRGGMEYPMLVMDGRVGEALVLHEIGHIYFFGILGNNERTEAWLDEGFTSFQTDWYKLERYGAYGITRDWNWYQRLTPQYTILGGRRRAVFSLERLGYGERVSTRAEEFKHSYRHNVYEKAALILFALRYVVGDDAFDRILKQYFTTWKFKHVTGKRFEDICEEVTGTDLSWFFEEWAHTRKICDYRLEEVKSNVSPSGDGYDVRVKIDRLGEIIMPLSLEFTFEDGAVHRERIDGRLRTIKQTYQFPAKPKKSALNPNNEIIDINMTDNVLPRRWDLQIDWPNNFYYPEDAYVIRHRPAVWYNDIDGLKVGYHIRSSHFDFYRRFQLGIYYGLKSNRVDFSTSYAVPTETLGLNGTLKASGYKMEGRRDFTLSFSLHKRSELIRPPSQQLTLAFNYHELVDTQFVINPEFYQTGPDIVPLELKYQVDPQFDILRTKTELGLRFGREWFGGDYKYTRFFGVMDFETRRPLVPFDGGMRIFLGLITGSMPNQQKFNLAGAGVLGQETLFFLRSPGAIWPDAHYLMPGDGNLRGYAEGTFPVNRLLTANFKLGKTVPWLSRPRNKWFGEITAAAFADIGTVLDKSNPIAGDQRIQALVDNGLFSEAIFDAGVGLRMHRRFPFWDFYLRYDIPFYANQPEVNGESKETQYRYLFSLTSVFSLSIN
jgi:hypothetical protein